MSNNGGGRKGGFKRESILELSKWMDAKVRVKCLGGRELEGTLKGYDDLVNLVLDDCDEYLRGKQPRGAARRPSVGSDYSTRCTRSPTRSFPRLFVCADPEDWETVTDKTRKLGLVVIRGTQVSLVSPQEGMEEIANPFVQEGGDDDE